MRETFWAVLGALASGVFVAGAGSAAVFAKHRVHPRVTATAIVYQANTQASAPWQGDTPDDESSVEARPRTPEVKRVLPIFDARLLAGCSQRDLDTIDSRLHDAIGIGAPLYNAGDVSGSYYAYDAAAHSIALTVEKRCKGPAKALEDGRVRAATRASLPEQAWAMRDVFDGLLDVIARRGTEL
ncbi:MAG TPA: hypothetical protein VGH28_00550 [Polyangiaceae bacterium]|jgi:hypothetical protein